MYWTYLTNSKNELLTLESNNNLEKMIQGYHELVETEFFKQFDGFDKLFISDKNYLENPLTKKLFEINLF
jgi:hypothetical protein